MSGAGFFCPFEPEPNNDKSIIFINVSAKAFFRIATQNVRMYVLVCKNPCTSLENFVPQLLIPGRFRILSINYKVLTGFAFFSMPGIGIQIHVYFTRIFKVQYTE